MGIPTWSYCNTRRTLMNYIIKLTFFIFVILTLFFIIKNTKKDRNCNKIVILDNGERINCMWVNTYKLGFSSIHKCDGVDITIKTDYIKNIEIK
jgi:hypothetical protein